MLAGPILAGSGVQVDTVTVVDGVVVVVVCPTRQAVPCPACGQLARRVHSHYCVRQLKNGSDDLLVSAGRARASGCGDRGDCEAGVGA